MNERFFSFEEARQTVAGKLEELNHTPFQKRTESRYSAYMEKEREFMLPSPSAPFKPAVWVNAKILNDYTVSDGLSHYYVPFDLIGEQVGIRMTKNTGNCRK